MSKNIDYICQQTEQMMLIETHEIRDATWPNRYVRPIARHFPYWAAIGAVSHADREGTRRRLWLIFSKQPLYPFYSSRGDHLVPGEEGVIEVDLSKSHLNYLDTVPAEVWEATDPLSASLLVRYRERLADLDNQFRRGEKVNISMSGEAYWLAFLCALAEFQDRDRLADDSVYLTWVRRGIEGSMIDPGLRYLLDQPGEFEQRMHKRFEALIRIWRERNVTATGMPIFWNLTPFHPSLTQLRAKCIVTAGSGEELCYPALDGFHRVFMARLLKAPTISALAVWEPGAWRETPLMAKTRNYEARMYQYLAGVPVEDPVLA